MSDHFMINVSMESHARLVSEWAYYKSRAETSADELEAIRRTVRRLVGVPDLPRLSDAELMTRLGAELLAKADGDPVGAEQPRGYVEYSKQPDGPPSLVVSVPAPPETPIASYEDFPVRAPGESPWLAPPQDGPPISLEVDMSIVRERERQVRAQAERELQWEAGQGVRCAEPISAGFCGARVTDGHCPDHGEVGPATETMPPVVEPPALPDGYEFGCVFTRGDAIADDTTALPRLLVNRAGEVWRYSGSPDPGYPGTAEFYCEALHAENSLDELLHMHGTLWEIVPSTGPVGEQVSGE